MFNLIKQMDGSYYHEFIGAEVKFLIYTGGETIDGLVIGNTYQLHTSMYSPDSFTKRYKVWSLTEKRIIINIDNFKSLEDIRDIKLKEILND